jgi:hypothetical protein
VSQKSLVPDTKLHPSEPGKRRFARTEDHFLSCLPQNIDERMLAIERAATPLLGCVYRSSQHPMVYPVVTLLVVSLNKEEA